MNAHIPILKAIAEGRLVELPACNKNQALRTLAENLSASAGITAGNSIFDNVIRREEQAITYLKYGIACPHARSENVGEMTCVIGWSPDGIEYGNTDGWPVHLILMYFVPYSARNAYLTELSTLARVIEADETKHELVNLKDLSEVKDRLESWIAAMEGREDAEEEREQVRRATCTVLSQLLMPDIVEMLEDRRLNDLRIFLAAQPPRK